MSHLSLQDKLNSETCEYSEMSSRYWNLTDTLMGGTDVIRQQGQVYLPKFADESIKGYENRLSRSYLFPGYSDTICRHAGKPFANPVQVMGLTDSRLTAIEGDVNLEGQNLTSFAKALFKDSENHGLSYTLVDMPATGSDGSVAGDIASNVRPKFIHIPATCLYYWRDEVIGNRRQLTEIIYKDEFRRYRWTREIWQVFRKANEGESRELSELCNKSRYLKSDSFWMLESEGENALGFVPLVVNYFNRIDWMTAKPPLYNMAEQNLQYYQDQSDQNSILKFARCGVYFAKGFSEDEADNISIGANKVISAADTAASFEVVEYGGTSITAGQNALDKLKSEMEMTGLKPELQATVDSTATGVIVNESAINSDLKVWAFVEENSLTRCYEIAATWLGVELPEDFEVKIYKDFTIAGRVEDMNLLLQSALAGKLSTETYLDELKSRGLVSTNVDTAKELERIAGSVQEVFAGAGFRN